MLLLEAGPDHTSDETPSGISSANFHDAVATPGRTWPGLSVRRHRATPPVAYLQARGVGGGSAINGLISMLGLPGDYDRWASQGAGGWAWTDVAPVFDTLRRLRGRLVEPRGLGALLCSEGSGLSACADYDVHGALGMAPARLMLDVTGRRVSVNDLYLDAARGRANLSVRGDAVVERVVLDERGAVGVQLESGETIDGAHVVVSCGAIGSPRLLMRSGVDRPGLGLGLRDHPAVGLTVTGLHPDGRSVITAAGRFSSGVADADRDVQILPVEWVGDDVDGNPMGMVLVALMEVRSTGRVTLDAVEFDLLHDGVDLARLVSGTRLALRALQRLGLPSPGGLQPDAPDSAVVDFMVANLADYQHACGTCRMGPALDPGAVVDPFGRVIGYSGLSVVDASVFPDIPRANPNLSVVMVAERMVQRWS